MANLPSAALLAERMREVARGEWPLDCQLEDISGPCLVWAEQRPEEINAAFRRFEEARLANRRSRSTQTQEEIRAAADELGKALLGVA